jgi:hypothetical protein
MQLSPARDRHCERGEAIQGNAGRLTISWIAASRALLAMPVPSVRALV